MMNFITNVTLGENYLLYMPKCENKKRAVSHKHGVMGSQTQKWKNRVEVAEYKANFLYV